MQDQVPPESLPVAIPSRRFRIGLFLAALLVANLTSYVLVKRCEIGWIPWAAMFLGALWPMAWRGRNDAINMLYATIGGAAGSLGFILSSWAFDPGRLSLIVFLGPWMGIWAGLAAGIAFIFAVTMFAESAAGHRMPIPLAHVRLSARIVASIALVTTFGWQGIVILSGDPDLGFHVNVRPDLHMDTFKERPLVLACSELNRAIWVPPFDPYPDPARHWMTRDVMLFDMRAGNSLPHAVRRQGNPRCLAPSVNGKLLGAGFLDGRIIVWDAVTQAELLAGGVADSQVEWIGFAMGDTRIVCVACDPSKQRTVAVYELPGGALLASWKCDLTGEVTGAVGSETDLLVLGTNRQGTLQCYDVRKLAFRYTLDLGLAGYCSVACCGGGATIVACGDTPGRDGDIVAWDAPEGRLLWARGGASKGNPRPAMCAAGTRDLLCLWEPGLTRIEVLSARRGDCKAILRGLRHRLEGCACDSGGNHVVGVDADGAVGVWGLEGF